MLVLGFSLAFYYRAPYHDHWDFIPLFAAFQNGDLSLGEVFAPHGGHWHASGYLVQLVLSQVTGMAHWAESLASVIFAGLGFVALVRILARSMADLEISGVAPWAFGLSAFFLFSLDQAGNWLWGWQVAVFVMMAGALWAIERLTRGPLSVANTLVAAVATAISIYAFATAWALIPIGFGLLLVFGALSSRTGWLCLALWSLLTCLLLWHLTLSRATVPDHVSSLPDLTEFETWIGISQYTLNFVASPIARFIRDSALLIAAIGIGVFVWSIRTIHQAEKRSIVPAIAPLLALAAFAWGAGGLKALGRWEEFGVQQAFVSRYISFGNLFWISVFVLAVFAIAKTNYRTHMRTCSVLGLLLLLKVGNIPSVVIKSVELSRSIAETSQQIAGAYPTVETADLAVLHSPSQQIMPHLEILATHRASFFHDYTHEEGVASSPDDNSRQPDEKP